MVVHQELDAAITAVARVGVLVEFDDGAGGARGTGFVDQAKHPSWWSEEEPAPQVGDRLHVVVLDASRTPPRLSALRSDLEVARRLRSAGT
ncbi:hypothetical protein OG883_04540 [Streptomyces sp. NBC_01142]|uniref:hypothetical protein n=1 Tax=Streptomyces sp. NBC_01142 TaxID=2975865 RepID=UPI002251BBD2|nr:hypothetical protein [Streptomyces sp. NBC_01142]MCX4819182.1 hypothetical protein [Streptomyces sp. NBC_01142]